MDFVSVIVPCYNEENTIGDLLEALNRQSYPKESFEVIIVDGQSTDKTLAVIEKVRNGFSNLNVKISSNPKRNIPCAVNIGIKESSGDIIVRMDAHSIPDSRYIEYCVKNLENEVADNVGGRWIIIPGSSTKMSKCISFAVSHPFGVGDAKYRYSSEPGYVDTVPYGAFHKTLIGKIGFFNEDLLANEDYEFNVRIRKFGGKIYFDPRIQTQYVARDTIKSLAKQYWRYGFWKLRMLKLHPETIRWRQAIPPIFVAGLLLLILSSIIFPVIWSLVGSILLIYILVLMLGTLIKWNKNQTPLCLLGAPIAIIIMHFSWGSGFLFSLITSGMKKKN